jgi:hypothetical protein
MLVGLKSLDETEAIPKTSTSTLQRRVEMRVTMVDIFMVSFLRNTFFRRNAALGFASPVPWRRELAKELTVAYWPEQAGRLIKWALVEAVSAASYFTNDCPLSLKGSGRWHASDGGGRYAILRDLILEALKSLHSPRELDLKVELTSLIYIATGEIPWRPEVDHLIRQIKVAFTATSITIGCKTVWWWPENRRITYDGYEVIVGEPVPDELRGLVKGYWQEVNAALEPHGLCVVEEDKGIFLKEVTHEQD